MRLVTDCHLCGGSSTPGKSCSFLIVSLSKGLSLYFMCSDQYVKYWIPYEFLLTSSLLLLDTHIHISHLIESILMVQHASTCSLWTTSLVLHRLTALFLSHPSCKAAMHADLYYAE